MASKTKYELALEIGGKIQSSLEKSVGGVNKKLDSIGKAAKTAAKIATAAFAAVKVGDFVKRRGKHIFGFQPGNGEHVRDRRGE